MDNSIYITLSRQLALFRDMAVTANNVANVNTTGYQAEKIMFTSFLKPDENSGVRNKMAFAHDVASYLVEQDGAMKATGNPLDVAATNGGYFTVETPLGTRYTRAGNFQIDSSGTLVTVEGYNVLDDNGQPIQFPEDAREILIGENGSVQANGEELAILGVAEFENPQLLERLEGGLYKSEINPQQSETARVAQGMLMESNVSPVLEMTHMIDVSRAVSSTAKFIEVVYDLQRKSNSTWTRQS